MTATATDFAALMPTVAPMLLGDPNTRLSSGTRLRFGNKGSVEVETSEGWFDDHEAKVRGGVLELIQHKRGCNMHGALSWLEEKGLKDRSKRENEKTFYDYRDASGAIAYRVERRGKDAAPPFLQHGPDGNGGFRSARGCMQGIAPLPYRLPELLAADPAAIVFVCEGEKDADRLARDGLVATTNSGGAGKFAPSLVPYFKGRRVVVLADNDPAGEAHALDVERKLAGVAAEVAVLRLPNLPPKGDVSDWLRANGAFRNTVADLEALAASALAGPANDNWPALDLSACSARTAPAREWVVDGWAPANKATLFAGDGGVGKSLLAQMQATCVAMGLPLLGLRTHRKAAAYLSWEDDADELWRRQEAICAILGVRMADLAGKLHLVSYTDAEQPFLVVTDADRGGVRVTALGADIERLVDRHNIGLLILDNASQIAGIDHNAVEEVAPFAHWLGTLAKRRSGAVILLHHTNKAGDDWLGSVAYNNQFRSRMLLARPQACPDPDVRVLSNPKANYAQAGGEIMFRWYNGAFVRDEDLGEDTARQIAEAARAGSDNAAFLSCLAERNRQQRAVSDKVGPNYAPSQFESMPQARGIGKARLKTAMDRLFAINAIERGFLWRDTAEGRDVHGLREIDPKASANASANDPKARSANAREQYPQTSETTHSPYYVRDGGASDGPQPIEGEGEWSTGWGEGG